MKEGPGMFKALGIGLVAIGVAVGPAWAQTSPTSSSTQGAFDKLSLGNQKIAQALCNAQPGGCPSTPSSATQKTLSRDEIAAMKQHKGFGEIFKQMKEQGLVQEKNLGQVISHANREAHAGLTAGAMAGSPKEKEPQIRATGTTLQSFEQQVLAPQGGLAHGTTPFEARFRNVAVTDQQQLLTDLQQLTTLPPDSRVRLQGTLNTRPFQAEVRNHEGQLRVELRGVRFATQQDAQTFVTALRTNGAERVRVRGVFLDQTGAPQRFDARFRAENGRVEQRFQVKPPEHEPHGTLITSGSGRSQVEGARGRPEVEAEHARRLEDNHGGRSSGLATGSSRTSGGGDRAFTGGGSGSGRGGEGGGGRGKD